MVTSIRRLLSAMLVVFVAASSAEMDNPHDLKLSPDGRYLFVSDVCNNRVVILDPDTLALVSTFGSDHQSGTHDVDFDAAGRAYVADTRNGRVTIYDLDGVTATLAGELRNVSAVPRACWRILTDASMSPAPGRATSSPT